MAIGAPPSKEEQDAYLGLAAPAPIKPDAPAKVWPKCINCLWYRELNCNRDRPAVRVASNSFCPDFKEGDSSRIIINADGTIGPVVRLQPILP